MAKGTIGERVYRRLLRLYPRDFSDDYADEMTHLYRDRVRGEGAASVWLALVADLARTAPREQIVDARAGRATRLADVAADAGPGARGGSDPGAGRRRQHRRLQRRARRAPEAVAVSGCGSSRRSVRGQYPRRGRAVLPRVAAQLSVVGRARPELRRAGGLQRAGLHRHGAW